MSRLTRILIPRAQRQSTDEMRAALDLHHGDRVSKYTGFLIMLVLSAVIAVAGVLADSTATVIGAMIIAPLATPILGIALGLVVGDARLVGRSFLWVLAGLGLVVGIGFALSAFVSNPDELTTNSQITGRTSPQLLDLLSALATGFAGAFAMCRRDLGAVLPGVAISISLVPPLGVVGVCAGQGAWPEAFGALTLFLSNVISLVIAGSIVFTVAGYARDPGSSATANRRRAYTVVAVLGVIIVLPLAVNTAVTTAVSYWTNAARTAAVEWLADDETAQVRGVTWSGLTVQIAVSSADGAIPSTDDLADALSGSIPDFLDVVVDVTPEAEYQVIGD